MIEDLGGVVKQPQPRGQARARDIGAPVSLQLAVAVVTKSIRTLHSSKAS
jgi:hypothetical protein